MIAENDDLRRLPLAEKLTSCLRDDVQQVIGKRWRPRLRYISVKCDRAHIKPNAWIDNISYCQRYGDGGLL